MTRADQAQQTQELIRSGANNINDLAKGFITWINHIASSGEVLAPENAEAFKQSQVALEKASKELLKVVVELEPYTLHVPDGKYAEIL